MDELQQIRFAATYYDGLTSQPHNVVVEAHRSGTLWVNGPGIAVQVDKDDVRIASRLGDTVRSVTFRNGAKIETHRNDAVDTLDEWFRDGRRGSWLHRLEARWHIAVGAVALLVALVAAGVTWGIPLAAEVVADRLPDNLAYQIGAGTLDTLDKTLFDETLLSDEEQEALREVFAEMAERVPELPLHLEFRKLGAPNAFALPDGTVVVTDGLVKLADDHREVMAVLAHEIGHVHHRHGLRMALESTTIALLVSVYLGDAAQMSTLLAALPAIYTEASYSRAHETEADTYALDFMTKVGLEPKHFATIMTKLKAEIGETGDEPAALKYMSSHPPTDERIARFE